MQFEFKLPDIGEGVVEGEVIEWHFQGGQYVHEDDPLVEVMTDKATVTIPSPKSGKIVKIFYEAGELVPVGNVLVIIDTDAAVDGTDKASPNVATAKSERASVVILTPTPGLPPASLEWPGRFGRSRRSIGRRPVSRSCARIAGLQPRSLP